VTVDPDGALVFAAAAVDNAVAVFSRNPATGALTFVERIKGDLDGVASFVNPLGLAVSADAAHLYVVANQSSRLGAFRILD
jgi:DNA-binding beta-propeller fold protein YncE